MDSRFVRKVRTTSGAVEIVDQVGHTVTGVEHMASACSDVELAVPMLAAREGLMPGQQTFDFGGLPQ